MTIHFINIEDLLEDDVSILDLSGDCDDCEDAEYEVISSELKQ